MGKQDGEAVSSLQREGVKIGAGASASASGGELGHMGDSREPQVKAAGASSLYHMCRWNS